MKVEAKLVSYTQPCVNIPASGVEDLLVFTARVSSERDYNTRADEWEGLLRTFVRRKHWSTLEMADATLEVQAPRDITRQLLRHGFKFQEFSQRYSDNIEFTDRDFRRQDTKNRQNSVDDFSEDDKVYYKGVTKQLADTAKYWYNTLRGDDVAKECARVILPEGLTMSTLYVKGDIRTWFHYLQVRDDPGVTQWEHVLLARECKKALEPIIPNVLRMLDD